MQKIIDLLDASAKQYPIKALADEIGKAESTLRNELTEQPGYKLGLRTCIKIMKATADLSPLDALEERFGRVAFRIPKAADGSPAPVMALTAKLTREFGEHMQALAEALEDGKVTKTEAEKCLCELEDVIKACCHLRVYLEAVR